MRCTACADFVRVILAADLGHLAVAVVGVDFGFEGDAADEGLAEVFVWSGLYRGHVLFFFATPP